MSVDSGWTGDAGDGSEDALAEVEAACLEVLGRVLRVPAANRRIGFNEGLPDCLVFDIGQAYTGDLNTFRAREVHMRATAEIVARDRAEVQRGLMLLRRAFPADADGGGLDGLFADCPRRVLAFRLAPENGNPSAVSSTEVALRTDARPVGVWTASAVFDVVFAADGGNG